MKKLKQQKAITLIALVITVIVLLILAGISIQAITNTGIFEGANRAKKEAKRAQIVEWLNLKLIEEQMYNPLGTAEEIIETTREEVYDNAELEKMGEKVVVDENTSTQEDGEEVDVYFYVQVDEDVYKVDMKGAQFIGEAGKFPPKIYLESITNTTNSITVQVSTKRNEGGTIEYYIKAEEEKEYGKPVTKAETETTYTYTGLEQNKTYNIKIVAVAANEQTAEVLVDKELGSVPDLAEGDITFTYKVDGQTIDKETWTNKNVTVTASTTVTGYTLKTSKDGKTWNDSTSQTFTENGQIYVVLYDGTNYGSSATGNVINIDTIAPTISTALSSTAQEIDSVTLSVGITDSNSGLGKVEWYYGTTDNPTTLAGTTSVTGLNGNTEGPTTAQTETYTLTGLTVGTTYYFKVIAYDVAGNATTSSVISVSTVTPTAEDVSYTPSNTSWGVNNVKSALDSLYNR